MKKSELRKIIRSIIAEQLTAPGPVAQTQATGGASSGGASSGTTINQSNLFQALGSPQTWGEAQSSYTNWYRNNANSISCQGGSSIPTPTEFAQKIRTGRPGRPTPRAIWIYVGIGIGLCIAYGAGYLHGAYAGGSTESQIQINPKGRGLNPVPNN